MCRREKEREREREAEPKASLAAQGSRLGKTVPNQRLQILFLEPGEIWIFPVSRPRQGSRLVLPRGVRGVATAGGIEEAKRAPGLYVVKNDGETLQSNDQGP